MPEEEFKEKLKTNGDADKKSEEKADELVEESKNINKKIQETI